MRMPLLSLALLPVLVRACVDDAERYCDAKILSNGSDENDCLVIDRLYWTHPATSAKTACFCGDEGKDVAERWWNCFYKHVARCLKTDDEGFRSSYLLWFQETCYWRRKRRLYCKDDWKPEPPWEELHNEDMKSYYDLESPNQYAFDSNELVETVNWVGCRPKDRTFRAEGWP